MATMGTNRRDGFLMFTVTKKLREPKLERRSHGKPRERKEQARWKRGFKTFLTLGGIVSSSLR